MMEIEKDRNEEIVNKQAIKTVIQQFVYMGFSKEEKILIIKNPQNSDMEWKGKKEMHVYETQFETFLCDATRTYYRQKSTQW